MRGDSSLSFTHIGTEIIEGKIQETLLSLESCHLFLYKLYTDKTFKNSLFCKNAIISENITITVFSTVNANFTGSNDHFFRENFTEGLLYLHYDIRYTS